MCHALTGIYANLESPSRQAISSILHKLATAVVTSEMPRLTDEEVGELLNLLPMAGMCADGVEKRPSDPSLSSLNTEMENELDARLPVSAKIDRSMMLYGSLFSVICSIFSLLFHLV